MTEKALKLSDSCRVLTNLAAAIKEVIYPRQVDIGGHSLDFFLRGGGDVYFVASCAELSRIVDYKFLGPSCNLFASPQYHNTSIDVLLNWLNGSGWFCRVVTTTWSSWMSEQRTSPDSDDSFPAHVRAEVAGF